ncbi:MAG: PglZ domain-containing protein [Sterolibacteriaceae bacterium]|uniref:PglZ domain-containing protein n=1 Tax=Candidatus Methylophosphatis roskildensis TaxID=2899263 RepID=A0A9D7E2L0_9PROT|nr:PglZ domain-containing protein [Candidatus Methylophosphatis roskildensis]MBK7235800.1 PglZ domain-containing protein [Sterolibacteriaceae bacterium]
MMHGLHQHIASTLDRLLRERRVVVFYDLREEFRPFLDELDVVGTGVGDLPRVCIHDTLTLVVRFEGSFFGLKAAVEPILAAQQPEPLLVYVPGYARERLGKLRGPAAPNAAQGKDVWNVLFELDCTGKSYEPSLRGLARNELRRRYTDGDIDEMLAPESLTYHDVVRFLLDENGAGGGSASLVKLVLGNGSSEELICHWIANEARDAELEAKQAAPELLKLVQARLGLSLSDVGLAKARHQTLRYVLINEFRSDFGGKAPGQLDVVPAPPTKEELQRVRDVAERLRREHPDAYSDIADGIERELNLPALTIDADALGTIDTFRFEEAVLLEHAARLIADAHYQRALELVLARRRSFWVDRSLGRLGQWETCRLMAELGREVARIRPLLKKGNGTPKIWVEGYAGDWYRADLAQRALESWVAKLEDEPEPSLEKALGLVRRNHEALLKEMTQGYTAALAAAGWSVSGVLHQTRIYPELVEPVRGRVAYFFVDAMRFEMAADLIEQLEGAQELRLSPAVGALPSITPIGMAALLPGASASFSVVDHKVKLAARIGDTTMPGLADRMKYLKAVRPEAVDIDLGELLQKSTRALEKQLADAPLVIVRSQSIDGLGEMDGGLLARQIMDTVIGNLARAVRKLARTGVEHFVITADHGHQFSIRKEEDMLMDRPGGDTVDQHRRCWAGRGGQTPTAATRVSGADLGYDTDLDFIFPTGLAVFRAGGDLAFHHGGPSLQEMIVPVVTLRIPSAAAETASGSKVTLEGHPSVLTNRTFGMRVVIAAELFSQEPVPVRLVLLAEGLEVGRCGMALDAELDRASGVLMVQPGKPANVAMMLTRDEFNKIRIVAQDPATDAVLAQSGDIHVKLGM